MKPQLLSLARASVLSLGCAAAQAPAADEAAAPAASRADISVPAADGPAPMVRSLESTRRAARYSAEWLARHLDSWFGETPFGEGGSVTDGRLSVDLLHRQDEGSKATVRFNARLRLPNVERSAYLLIGRDNEREVVTDRPGALSPQQRLVVEREEEQKFFAGFGVLLDAFDLRIGLRGGPKPYAQARYRKAWDPSDADRVDLRQTIFWTLDDRVGSTTALAWEHPWSSTWATRWLNAATITQRSGKFEWSSVLGAYKLIGADRVLSLEALALGRQGSGVGLTDYGLRVRWQQPVYKDWLVGDVIVGQFWPRPDADSVRARAWAVGAGLMMKF
ncbi:MAG: hypothetical protein HYZ20_12070 [Burkholderiales bacterium]|nr:hypothetical protein [Burkholderiales bacterium]